MDIGDFVAIGTVGSFIVIAVVAISVGNRAKQRRRLALSDMARELGFNFSADAGVGILADHAHLRLFNQGQSRTVFNLLDGRFGGHDVAVFDYSFVTGSGKNRSTHYQTIVSIHSLRSLPLFELRPEHILHKIGQLFGYQDIDFETHPDFSKRYLVRGQDEKAVRHTLGYMALSTIESLHHVTIEGGADRFIFFECEAQQQPDAIRRMLTDAIRVFKSLSPG